MIASSLDESKYERVTLGRKEGEVMKDLIYKHSFFKRKEYIDFQGSCRISPEKPKVDSFYLLLFYSCRFLVDIEPHPDINGCCTAFS